jgi:hypothetical protein
MPPYQLAFWREIGHLNLEVHRFESLGTSTLQSPRNLLRRTRKAAFETTDMRANTRLVFEPWAVLWRLATSKVKISQE